MMKSDVIVIGGGQAGLAMSRCLSDARIDHLVIERGRVGERWRSERWDSLRLLTPNWQTRLPGFHYDGPDQDGFMTAAAVTRFLERYAGSFRAPVQDGTHVQEVTTAPDGFRVSTDRGTWQARAVVMATGYCDVPLVPAAAATLSSGITQLVPTEYRSPAALPPGGVLVVGASSTGIQLADEIRQSGRSVTIAVGHHLRMPRRYRGLDIMWWLDRSGMLDATQDDVHDVEISRSQPSLQLVGRPDHSSLDLAMLKARGVGVVGRLTRADGERLHFADDLVATTAASDAKLAMLLWRLDEFARQNRLDDRGIEEAFRPQWPQFLDAPTTLHATDADIRSVIWATGYRRAYPWLHVPVLDERGEIRQRGGVTPTRGLYALGLQFMRRRNSNFIDGVGRDAHELTIAIAEQLGVREAATERFIA